MSPILQAIQQHLNQNGIPAEPFSPYNNVDLNLLNTPHWLTQDHDHIKLRGPGAATPIQFPISDPELLTKITKHLKSL